MKDNEGLSSCAFQKNEMTMWYDQKLWEKLEEDVNGRTIEPGGMTDAVLRLRPTSSTGQCYCRWPNCWISVNAQRAKLAFCRHHKKLPAAVYNAIDKGKDKDPL